MIARLPLWLAGLLVLLVVLFLGWTEYTNWRELVRLQQRFSDLELDSAAAEFQAGLLKLNGLWATQSLGGRDSAFEAEGERLRAWLQSCQQGLADLRAEAAAEPGLVAQVSARLNAYLDAARRLSSPAAAPGSGPPAEVQGLQTEWEALIALSEQWTRLHRASLEAEIAEAQRSLGLLHALLAVSSFLLLALALAVLVLVNRGLLAPLRRQLVASHAIIARQEKLASLGVQAAGVAHEIRNPLTAINARLFSQQKRLAAGSPEHADALVIKEEIQRLERIVRDVLHQPHSECGCSTRFSPPRLPGPAWAWQLPSASPKNMAAACSSIPNPAVVRPSASCCRPRPPLIPVTRRNPARRIGRFEQAHGGTLFLDEVGDMTPGTQVKLLRVLQEKAIQRVGGKDLIPVDVRILAATHRDLEAAVAAHQFREDLLYRLNVVTLTLPPLEQRSEDIPALVSYFLHRYGVDLGVPKPAIQPEALELLQRHPWPGNVRELENTVRKALLLSRGYPIDAGMIQSALTPGASSPVAASGEGLPSSQQVGQLLEAARRGELSDVYRRVIERVERELFAQALTLAEGNLTRAAAWLGITRLTLREKLTAFGLRPER